MFVNKEIKARVEQKLRDCIAIVEKRYNTTVKFPKVVYHKRGTTAGTANYRTWTIDLNPVLLNENVEEMINDTVPHELAHLVDFQLYPENYERRPGQKRSVHGYTWKCIMMVMGSDPSRCHNMDTTNARVRAPKAKVRYTWICKCGSEMRLGPKRHKKMLNGLTKYWQYGHQRCGGYTYGQPMTKVANEPAPKPVVTPTEQKRPWKEVAVEVYGRTNARAQFIEVMMKLGCGKATASTYHHNCKSGKWC